MHKENDRWQQILDESTIETEEEETSPESVVVNAERPSLYFLNKQVGPFYWQTRLL